MITKKKELKIYGWVMFFLGFIDLGYVLLEIGEVGTYTAGQSAAVVAFLYAFIALGVLLALIKFWLGRQALRYAKGTGTGTSHILLSKIGLVICMLVVISDTIAVLKGTASPSDTYGNIASLILMISYHKTAKECL